MRWVIPLFVAVPLLELFLLLQLATLIDFWPTVALVVGTGLLGGILARREGRKVWREWQQALTTLTPPEAGVLDGVLVLAGAVLLITPGVLTDGAGLLLLFPITRRVAVGILRKTLDHRLGKNKPNNGNRGVWETSGEVVAERTSDDHRDS